MNNSSLETDSKPSTRLAPAASVLVALLIAIITLHGRVPVAIAGEFIIDDLFYYPRLVTANPDVVIGLKRRNADGTPLFGRTNGIWTRGEGVQELVNPGFDHTSLSKVSDDGKTVFGGSWNETDGITTSTMLFRWTSETGFSEILPPAEHRGLLSSPEAMSGDGAVLVGGTNTHLLSCCDLANNEIFRWTEATGSVILESPLGGNWRGYVNDMSYDGSVLVGIDIRNLPDRRAEQGIVWTPEGAEVIAAPDALGTGASANAVSTDGSVIVGSTYSDLNPTSCQGNASFRWTKSEGKVDLGCFPGGTIALAGDVSADGNVVVGTHRSTMWLPSPRYAAVWDVGHGWRDLETVIHDEHGMSDFQLRNRANFRDGRAISISDDKQVISGNSYEIGAGQIGWVVYLDRPIDSWSADAGDFDGNGTRDAADIDALSAAVREGNNDLEFELYEDGIVDDRDRTSWVKFVKETWFGDANLDGEFNTSDLVSVLASGTYEADVDAVWSTGDFDGDGRANTSDLVAALADGGYEQGPRAAAQAVPEPSSAILAALALLTPLAFRRGWLVTSNVSPQK